MSRLIFYIFLTIFLFNSISFSQIPSLRINSYSSCGAGSASLTEISGLVNPAQLGNFKKNNIFFSVSPLKYGLKELNPAVLFAGVNINDKFSFGGGIFGISNDLYTELSFTVAGSYKIGDKFVTGGSIEYSNLSVSGFGNDYMLQFNIGGLIFISDKLKSGFIFRNLGRDSYTGGEETVHQSAVFGLGYKIDQSFSIDVDAIVVFENEDGISLSALYDHENILKFRLAFVSNPRSVEGGINIRIVDNIRLISSLIYYDNTGWVKDIGISIIFP